MHGGIHIPPCEVLREPIFFGALTWVPGIGNTYGMNVLVPVRAQMRRWCFEPF
jgi:hypothetical protein